MAGSNDFTGQNIQDTYQRVLQLSSSGQLADGTGSLVPLLDVTASFAVSASHEITKEVTSSYAETASAAEHDFNIANDLNFDATTPLITANGENMFIMQPSQQQTIFGFDLRSGDGRGIKFGADSDYTIKHAGTAVNETKLTILEDSTIRYTFGVGGHLTASSGVNIKLGQAAEYRGQGANITAITSSTVSASDHIQTNTLKGGGDDVSLNVLGSISSSGGLFVNGKLGVGTITPGKELDVTGEIRASGDLTLTDGDIRSNNTIDLLTTTGAAQGVRLGTLVLSQSFAQGTNALGAMSNTFAAMFGGDVAVGPHNNGNLGVGVLTPTEKLQVEGNISASGNVSASGDISGSSLISQTHITASGEISASGTIYAGNFHVPGQGRISFDHTDIDDQFIKGLDNSIIIDADDLLRIRADHRIAFEDESNNAQVEINAIEGNISASGDISGSSLISQTHVTASGNISSSGTITANSYVGLPSGILSSSAQLPSGIVSGSAQIADVTLTTAAQTNITSLGTLTGLTVDGDLTVNGDTVTFESANSEDPQVTIKNTTNGTNDAAQLFFVKDRGVAPAVGTNLGEVRFVGEDSAQNSQEYAGFLAEIDVATNGQESGQFGIFVATHDGELAYGLQLTGGSEEDEIDVRIASGSNSVTTVAGSIGAGSHITASGNISASGDIITKKLRDGGGNNHIVFGDQSNTIAISSDDTEIIRVDGDSQRVGINKTAPGEALEVVGNISASGDIYGQTIYGHQFEQFSSNFTFNFDGTNTDTVFMPISDQSVSEHASSATNVNVNRTSVVPGRPIKTTVRSTANTGLKNVEITCSVFYNQPGKGSAGAAPGATNAGQFHLVTAKTLAPNANHQPAELDFTTDNTGSVQDVPAGSRFYMTMVARGTGSAADLINTTFVVSNLWRWDYTQL